MNTNSMLNPNAHLAENIFDTPAEAPTRDGFGAGLVEAGEKNPQVVALCADLSESTRMHLFAEKFPERFIEIGVAEQNLAAVASGLANYGKIPFIASYATFSPGRNNEQIRTTISINNVKVIIAGSHAGVSVGPDGATHQALEDIALMRVQPHMTVICPCDAEEARKATLATLDEKGPVYIRLAREKTPVMTTSATPFVVGKALVFFQSEKSQALIVSTGTLLHNALCAAKELEAEGVGVTVLHCPTVKPLDEASIIGLVRESGAVVTVEEHQIAGGFGSAVMEVLARECPVPVESIGVRDMFGQSGTPKELIEHYGMGVSHIKEKVMKVIARKR